MVDYRCLVHADVDRVTAFAIEGMRPQLYEGHLAPHKVRAMVEHFVGSTSDWHLAAFEGERVLGIAAVQVRPQPWFERHEGVIVALRAIDGAGAPLIQAMKAWFRSDMRVRRLMWPLEADADKSMKRLARQLGFNSEVCVRIAEKP